MAASGRAANVSGGSKGGGAPTQFCPACGEDVGLEIHVDGLDEQYRCCQCYHLLWTRRKTAVDEKPLERLPAAGPPTVPELGSVMVVDDSRLIREILRDELLERKAAARVHLAGNGVEFLSAFASLAASGARVGLAIVDFHMPLLNGAYAGLAMRAFERGFGIDRTPLLFFSAIRADEKIKSLMEHLGGVAYVFKTPGADPAQMVDRLFQVLSRLAHREHR